MTTTRATYQLIAASLLSFGVACGGHSGMVSPASESRSPAASVPSPSPTSSPTPAVLATPAPATSPLGSPATFTDRALNISLSYPAAWFVLPAYSTQPNEQDFSSQPNGFPRDGSTITLRFLTEQTDRASCLGWNRLGGPQLNVTDHGVGPADGLTYTTEPPIGAEAVYGFGSNQWFSGRCAHLAFIQYQAAARQANQQLELAIVDSVHFG